MGFVKHCSGCQKVFKSEMDIIRFSSSWQMDLIGRFLFSCDQCHKQHSFDAKEVAQLSTPLTEAKTSSLFAKLLQKDRFPHLPTSVVEISKLLRNPDSTAQEIALAAKKDPIVGAGILNIANNLKSSTGLQIKSLEHAITYIGRETVLLITFTAALGMMKTKTTTFRAKDFWQEAFLTAHIAEYLAGEFALNIHKDQAFLAGALCNIGKLVNAIYSPETIDRVAALAEEATSQSSWVQAEHASQSLSHAKVGEFASIAWGLPKFIIESIRHHHDLPKFGVDRSRGLSMAELTGLANQIMHLVNGQHHRVDRDIFNGFCNICKISPTRLGQLLTELAPFKSKSISLVNNIILPSS